MMKKSILSVFIFIYFAVLGQSSVYHPFPEGYAVWNVEDSHNHLGTCCGAAIVWERSYMQQGDTLIDNLTYHKLYKNEFSYESYFPTMCSCEQLLTHEFAGGLREDLANKKVYFYNPVLSQENLLYDFNLLIGDPVLPSSMYHITSIDSVSINGSYRKRFNCNYSGQFGGDTSIIEGIGSVQGLLNGLTGVFEGYNRLLCFQNNNVTEFINPNVNTPCQIVHAAENNLKNEQLISIPNPLSGEEHIHFGRPLSDASLRIHNLQGQPVFEILKITTAELTLDCRNFEPGIYTIRIVENGECLSRRKVLVLPEK